MSKRITKIVKINESFTVNLYENGYMVEVNGSDKKDEYITVKLIVATEKELLELVQEILSMDRAF